MIFPTPTDKGEKDFVQVITDGYNFKWVERKNNDATTYDLSTAQNVSNDPSAGSAPFGVNIDRFHILLVAHGGVLLPELPGS